LTLLEYKHKNFSSTSIPNTGAWVLENDFSIETWMSVLICNPFSIF